MTNRPSKEQLKKFWERGGFKEVKYLNTSNEVCAIHWAHPLAPDGGNSSLPELDLNNLFRYAVPKTLEELKRLGAVAPMSGLFARWSNNICAGYNFEDGLFWALWKVIK